MAKSGRKTVKDKKVQVTFYVKKSAIQYNGGMTAVRSKCIYLIEHEGL